jgi:hypothetical protein
VHSRNGHIYICTHTHTHTHTHTQVSGDFGALADKCAAELVNAIAADIFDAASAYMPNGQMWTAAVRDSTPGFGRNGGHKGGGGGGSGEVAVSEISESIVEVLEILRDHLW